MFSSPTFKSKQQLINSACFESRQQVIFNLTLHLNSFEGSSYTTGVGRQKSKKENSQQSTWAHQVLGTAGVLMLKHLEILSVHKLELNQQCVDHDPWITDPL